MPRFACSNGAVAARQQPVLPPRKPPFCVGKKVEGLYKELQSSVAVGGHALGGTAPASTGSLGWVGDT